MALLLHFTGLAKVLEDKMDLDGASDMHEQEWGDSFLTRGDVGCEQVIKKVISNIPGKRFDGLITHKKGTGERSDEVYANFKKFTYYGKGEKKSKTTSNDELI